MNGSELEQPLEDVSGIACKLTYQPVTLRPSFYTVYGTAIKFEESSEKQRGDRCCWRLSEDHPGR